MSKSWQCIGAMVLWAAWGAAAHGQFAPPDAGSSAASPAGGVGGGMSVSPPPAVADPAGRITGPLSEVRANQTMTASAMIGFVNDEPVFLTDVFRPIDADLKRLANTSGTLPAFRQAAAAVLGNQLSQLVSEQMVVAAAELQLTEQDHARIAAFMALQRSNLIAEHGGSVPATERALAAAGTTVDREMADKRRRVIKELYFQKNLVPRIVVTRQMLMDAYEKDPKRWQQVAQVELYTITLPITNWLREPTTNGVRGAILTNPTAQQIADAEAQAVAQGKEIVAKLKAGADFARLVEDYDSRDSARSFGGRKGMINKGAMVNTKLEDYVFSLRAESVGEPQLLREAAFRDTTVVVARIGKKTESRVVPFAEAQAQLSTDLRNAQLRELQSQEMERLARGATIEAIDRMRDVALDAAVTRYMFK